MLVSDGGRGGWTILVSYNLPQTSWLKTVHIYYLTVSVDQDSGHGSAQGLTRLQSRCQLGL